MNSEKSLQWIVFAISPSTELANRLTPLNSEAESELVQNLHHHLLASRAHRIFAEFNVNSLLSEQAQNSFMRGYLGSIAQHTAYATELTRLEQQLNFPFAKLKGIHLARRLYENPYDRSFSDLDLLFLSKDKANVRERLLTLDYREEVSANRFYANDYKIDFVHEDNSTLRLEAHFGLGPTYLRLEEEETLIRMQKIELHPDLEYGFLLQHGLIQHRLQKAIWLLDLEQILNKFNFSTANLSKELSAADRLTRKWLEQISLYSKENKTMDSLLKDILLVKIDQNHIKTAFLRAKLMGGWPKFIRYALARANF